MKRLLWTSALLAIVAVTVPAAPPAGSADSRVLVDRERDGVKASLAWLARRQEENGSWKATSQPGHGFERLYEPDAAAASTVLATASALMAFLGDGNSPWVGPWRETVARGWNWLQAEQAASFDGLILPQLPDEQGTTLAEKERILRRNHVARLNHLWGTIALCEVAASAEWDDPELTEELKAPEALRRKALAATPAEAAVRFITLPDTDKAERYDFLNPKTINMDELVLLGAVRYVFGRTGLKGNKDWFVNAEKSLAQVQEGQSEKWVPWRYSIDGEYWFRGSISTPQRMIAPVYFNMTRDGAWERMVGTIPLLLANPPVWNCAYEIGRPSRHPEMTAVQVEAVAIDVPASLQVVSTNWRDDITNEAAWFWSGMAFRSHGEAMPEWQARIVPVLCDNQESGGPDAGSWDPAGPHARVFGREIATAWNSITLNMRNRLAIANSHWTQKMEDPRWEGIRLLGELKATREKCAACGAELLSSTLNSSGRGGKVFYFCSQAHKHHFEMHVNEYLDGTPPPLDEHK